MLRSVSRSLKRIFSLSLQADIVLTGHKTRSVFDRYDYR